MINNLRERQVNNNMEENLMHQMKSEMDVMQNKIKFLELKLEYMEKSGLRREEYTELVKEIATLKASLKEIKNDREEDKSMIYALSGKIEDVEKLIRQFIANTAKIEISQQDVVKQVDTMDKRVNNKIDSLEAKIEKLTQLMTFNWVEMVKNFINYNLVTKLFSYFSFVSIIFLIIEMVLYYLGIPIDIKAITKAFKG
jgi:chromosome segregation ATPase